MPSRSTASTGSRLDATKWTAVADFGGRVAFAAIFIMSGAAKLFGHTAETVQFMETYGVPVARMLVYPAGLVELLAAIARALGFHVGSAAPVLALYVVTDSGSSGTLSR